MALVSAADYPKYRLRLFLSVDLAGSTAFKAGDGKRPSKGSASQPIWVETTRDFYQEFPSLIEKHYVFLERADLQGRHPKVWKTVGDEIIFCCRIIDTTHLSISMNAFLKALTTYGDKLKKDAREASVKGLDVKGAAWIATFPHPNVTVALDAGSFTADQFDEGFELAADNNPRSVDFLGNGIDCGFRVASRATVDRCPLSAELAFLLAIEAERSNFKGRFSSYDRCSLKGVLNDRPYPIVYLETERSDARRRVRHHERKLTGSQPFEPIDVHTFLHSFMQDEGIELPILPHPGEDASQLPDSYNAYKETWINDVNEIEQRNREELASEKPENSEGETIPQEVQDFTSIVDRLRQTFENVGIVPD